MKKMGKTFCFSFVEKDSVTKKEERKSFDIWCEDEGTTLLQVIASNDFVNCLEDNEIILIGCANHSIPKENWACVSKLDLRKGLTRELTVDLIFEAVLMWQVSYRANSSSDLLTILN